LILESVNRSLEKWQPHGARNLPCKRIQVDEIWAFVYAKQKNVATAKAAPVNTGDVWTWTGYRY